jgi:hypothetical protein
MEEDPPPTYLELRSLDGLLCSFRSAMRWLH